MPGLTVPTSAPPEVSTWEALSHILGEFGVDLTDWHNTDPELAEAGGQELLACQARCARAAVEIARQLLVVNRTAGDIAARAYVELGDALSVLGRNAGAELCGDDDAPSVDLGALGRIGAYLAQAATLDTALRLTLEPLLPRETPAVAA